MSLRRVNSILFLMRMKVTYFLCCVLQRRGRAAKVLRNDVFKKSE